MRSGRSAVVLLLVALLTTACSESSKSDAATTSAPTTATTKPPAARVVFATNYPGQLGHVRSIGIDGSDERAESDLPVREDQRSPDRTQIVIDGGSEAASVVCPNNSVCSGLVGARSVVRAQADGAMPKVLTTKSLGYVPRWSPVGPLIAYTRPDPGGRQITTIALVDPDGRDVAQLPYAPGRLVQSHAWSSDGKRLAIAYEINGEAHQVVVYDIATKTERVVSDTNLALMEWSPDGKMLVGTRPGRRLPEPNRFYVPQLVVLPLDGGDARVLAEFTFAPQAKPPYGCSPLDAYGGEVADPMWSPDSKQIAFTSNAATLGTDPRAKDVWVINADGSGLTKVRSANTECKGPNGDNERLVLLGWH